MTSNLLKATKELLDQTSLEDWKRIAKEMGVTVNWLRQLDSGAIAEPGVNKVERLYEILSGNKLNV